MITKKQAEEIKRVGLYDFIASNWYQMNPNNVAELFREFNYAVYELDKELELKAVDRMLENIEDQIEEEEEEDEL